jgi:hypothetical protein
MLLAMGSFALVAGGIAPGEVFAPRGPERLNVYAAAAVTVEPVFTVDPASLTVQPIVPDRTFITSVAMAVMAAQPAEPLSTDTLRAYASIAGWPSDLHDELLVVARCESHYRPLATNGAILGLMQMHPMWFAYTGTPIEEWDDPIANLRVAYGTYQYDLRRGNEPWAQWQCKPDGTVVAAAVVAESAPANAEALAADLAAAGNPSPTPTATPAPWDEKPAWPPKPGGTSQPTQTPAP